MVHEKKKFLTFSKTTEPIELKFIHKILVGSGVVFGYYFFFKCVCLSMCLSVKTQKAVFSTFSKTTKPIELKFTRKIRVGPEVVLGIF